MPKMRIAYISKNFYPIKRISGSINFSYGLCEALARLCDLHVINPATKGFPKEEKHKGYTIHRVSRPFTASAARKASSLQPDVTILRSGVVDLPFLVPQVLLVKAFLPGKKLVLYQKTAMARQSPVLFRLADPFLEKVICSSSGMHKFFGKASKKAVFVAPGIKLDAVSKAKPAEKPKSRVRIGYIGHLFRAKGPDRILDAFSSLDLPNAELLISGYGELEPALRRMAARSSKAERIKILGFEKNPYPLIASCDFLVFPFRESKNILGTALTAIEAAGMGKSLIGSNDETLTDLIEHGKNGFIFENEEQLRQQVRLLAISPKLREQLGKNARDTVKRSFDINSTAKEVLLQCQKISKQ